MGKNIILMGKGDLAIRVAQWFHESPDYDMKLIVPVMPEPGWAGSLKGWAEEHGVATVDSGHYKDIPGVKDDDWSIDLCFSVFYDKIIKAWYIDKCKRILNLHNGPLPRYRGVSPINWALKNNESEHGVTIHEITPGVDDGPIVSQVKYSIYPEFDEVVEVYQRALGFGYELFEKTMPILDKIEARPQDESAATFYHSRDNDKLGDRQHFTRADSPG